MLEPPRLGLTVRCIHCGSNSQYLVFPYIVYAAAVESQYLELTHDCMGGYITPVFRLTFCMIETLSFTIRCMASIRPLLLERLWGIAPVPRRVLEVSGHLMFFWALAISVCNHYFCEYLRFL